MLIHFFEADLTVLGVNVLGRRRCREGFELGEIREEIREERREERCEEREDSGFLWIIIAIVFFLFFFNND